MATLVGHVLPEGLRRFFLRAGFLRSFGRLAQLGRFAVQQVFAELQRVQFGKELIQCRQRIAVIQRGLPRLRLLRLRLLPRACLDGPAKPLRRRFPVGHKALGGRGDTGRREPLDAPLTDAVEPADAVHLRVKKLDAQGVALVGREHVQNGAPHGALAAALHHGDPLVAAGQQAVHQFLQRHGQVDGLRRDGHDRRTVGGNDGIDGADIGAGVGKDAQDLGQKSLLVVEQQLEGDDAAGHHALEGQHGVPVLVERAAADVGHAGGFVDGGRFAGGKQTLCLRYLQENLRQGGRLHNIVFGFGRHVGPP